MSDLAHANIIILGLGREGLSSYHFLRQQFPEKKLILADQNQQEILFANFPDWQEVSRSDQLLEWRLGDHYLEEIDQVNWLIKTAGIPITLPEIQTALEKNPGLEISSNMQLFFDRCPGIIIGVTGSKGKSTTSQLSFELLSKAGNKTVLVGNIGRPALNYLNIIDQGTLVVAELSSHQLAELKSSPQVAVILDVTPEHLDYFASFDSYFNSKTAIVRYQTPNDWLIFNPDLAGAKRLAQLSATRSDRQIKHSLEKKANRQLFVDQETIFWQLNENAAAEKIIDTQDIPILGKHNLNNVLSAIAVAKLFEINNDSIVQTITEFKGLAHRLELVNELDGVKYYDDSIGTNPIAGAAAIRSFAKGKVILLAGGHDKKLDFADYIEAIIQQEVKAILLFPPTGETILTDLKKAWQKQDLAMEKFPKTLTVNSMAEAIKQAQAWAKTGDVVLLSPACASFGVFKNYQDRGEQFQAAIKAKI